MKYERNYGIDLLRLVLMVGIIVLFRLILAVLIFLLFVVMVQLGLFLPVLLGIFGVLFGLMTGHLLVIFFHIWLLVLIIECLLIFTVLLSLSGIFQVLLRILFLGLQLRGIRL